MRIAAIWIVLLGAACVAAGLYGAVHNQVSYTISPDYFHAFKFKQFHVAPGLQNRVGASWVGWQAAWWMGVVAGGPLILVGRKLFADWSIVRPVLEAYLVLTITALLIGGGALLRAYLVIDAAHLPPFWIPPDAVDPVAFSRAGELHDASYAGAVIGVLSGAVWQVYRSRRGTSGAV